MIAKLRGVSGVFGWGEEVTFSSTYRVNEKGGMRDDKFEKYVMTNITHLYPDLADVEGKRFVLKVDSGPCQEMKKRLLGFYFVPWGAKYNCYITRD